MVVDFTALCFLYFADIDYGEYTMKKRVPLIFLCCMIICGAGYAETLGFACIYNSDAPTEASELTAALETELFDICFDNGIIATSVEYRAEGVEQYKDNALLLRRFDSSVDYVVALYCEYKQGSGKRSISEQPLEWKQLKWKIIDFSSQSVLFEESIEPAAIPESELKQKVRYAGKAIGGVLLKNL